MTVPPVLACVLSRVEKRHQISNAIRDLREEYARSRTSLWSFLEEMWEAGTLKKQVQMKEKLERASQGLFPSTFPDRFPYLDTAWSVAIDIAELRPLSALRDAGKALLNDDQARGHVSAISFTRQFSSDLAKISGMSRMLRKILTRAEAARFGIH